MEFIGLCQCDQTSYFSIILLNLMEFELAGLDQNYLTIEGYYSSLTVSFN